MTEQTWPFWWYQQKTEHTDLLWVTAVTWQGGFLYVQCTIQQLLVLRGSPSSIPREPGLPWLQHFPWAQQLQPAWQPSPCPHCWLALTASPWPVLSEVSFVTAHCNGFATGLTDLSALGRGLGLFFLPFNEWQRCWPGCEFILWRAAWEHGPCSVVRAEWSSLLPAQPEAALLCPKLSLLSKGTHTGLHTHRDAQGLEQSQQANQTHNKTHPTLIHPSLFSANSWRKFNQEQPEVSAMHSQLHISTIIWLSCVTTHWS